MIGISRHVLITHVCIYLNKAYSHTHTLVYVKLCIDGQIPKLTKPDLNMSINT